MIHIQKYIKETSRCLIIFILLTNSAYSIEDTTWIDTQIQKEFSLFNENEKIDSSFIKKTFERRSEFPGQPNIVIIKNQKVYTNVSIKIPLEEMLKYYELPDMIFYYYFGAGPRLPMKLENGFAPPIFAGNKTSEMENVILIFDRMAFTSNLEYNKHYGLEHAISQAESTNEVWELRKSQLFWRGQLTDVLISGEIPTDLERIEKFSSRKKLVELSKYAPSLIDAVLYYNVEHGNQPLFLLDYFSQEELPHTFDFTSMEDHLSYKYQICLDGLTCTNPGYAWRLRSNSLVFKVDSPNYQWFYAGLKPWIHYVPVKKDLSDLIEKILLFRERDEWAKEIAQNAKEFSQTFLTKEMFFLYAYKVLCKWASLQQLEEKDFEEAFKILKLE